MGQIHKSVIFSLNLKLWFGVYTRRGKHCTHVVYTEMFHISKDLFFLKANLQVLFPCFITGLTIMLAIFPTSKWLLFKIAESDLLEIRSYLILNTAIHRLFSQLTILVDSANCREKHVKNLTYKKSNIFRTWTWKLRLCSTSRF